MTRPRSLWNGTIAFGEIRRKQRGGEIEIPEVEPEPDPVPDLLAALEASLSRAKSRA